MARTLYDTTYDYIKGTIDITPEKLEALNFNTAKNTPIDCSIEFETEKLREFEITGLPNNGSVTFDPDGSFTFYPEHDFTGTVTFTYRYSEYLGWSEDCTVVINVQ